MKIYLLDGEPFIYLVSSYTDRFILFVQWENYSIFLSRGDVWQWHGGSSSRCICT